MTPPMLLTLLLLTVASLGALWYGVKHAVRGYEDEFGFHEGIEPKPLEIASATQSTVVGTWSEAPHSTRGKARSGKAQNLEHASLGLL